MFVHSLQTTQRTPAIQNVSKDHPSASIYTTAHPSYVDISSKHGNLLFLTHTQRTSFTPFQSGKRLQHIVNCARGRIEYATKRSTGKSQQTTREVATEHVHIRTCDTISLSWYYHFCSTHSPGLAKYCGMLCYNVGT